MRSPRINDHGTTMVLVLILLFGFLALAIGGLSSATSDLKVTRNYTSSMQALVCAEAGLLHGQKVADATGTIRFNVDVVPLWGSLFGNAAVAMPGQPDCEYTVTAAEDTSDPWNFMFLTSVGVGPEGSRRTVRSRLTLGNTFSPGAIYLSDPDVDTRFSGNSFVVDGNDHDLNGDPGPSQPVPGIATSGTLAAENVLASLNDRQKDNVIGLGGDASVFPAPGPSVDEVRALAQNILNQAASSLLSTNPPLAGNDTFGTLLQPRVTHFTSSVSLNGTINGAGALIVDGGLKINGNMEFTGLIIVRGKTEILTTTSTVSGSSSILGGLWTTDLRLEVGGHASVTYSTEALNLVNAMGTGDFLPKRVRAVSWSRL